MSENKCKPNKQKQIDDAIVTLDRAELKWESSNNGVHMQVYTGTKGVVDFWPTTGKWRIRDLGKNGVGISDLLEEVL